MNRTCDEFLAGAAGAADEHGRGADGHLLHRLEHVLDAGGGADDVLEVILRLDLLLEIDVLREELLLYLDFVYRNCVNI